MDNDKKTILISAILLPLIFILASLDNTMSWAILLTGIIILIIGGTNKVVKSINAAVLITVGMSWFFAGFAGLADTSISISSDLEMIILVVLLITSEAWHTITFFAL